LRKLRDGQLNTYIPTFTIMDETLDETTVNLTGSMRASFMKDRFRRASQIQLEKEKESNIKLLTKLSEMREEQDNFEENQKKEQEEYEREQRKIEDEWNDLKVSMAAAEKTLKRETESLETIKGTIKKDERKCEAELENAEQKVQKERRRFNLRSPKFNVNDTEETGSSKMRRRRTVIENTAPSAHAGVLGMLTGDSEPRDRDVWYLTISGSPFMEWADVSDQLNPPSATRMRIAKVFNGKREFQGRAFVVHSARKDKKITFITSKPTECQKWIRTIKNGLGLLSDSEHAYIDEAETKVEVDVGNSEYIVEYAEQKEHLNVEESKEQPSMNKVSEEVTGIVMRTVAAELEAKGIVGETEV